MRSQFTLKGGFTAQRLVKLSKLAYQDLTATIGEKSFIGFVSSSPEIYVRQWLSGFNHSPFFENLSKVTDVIEKAKTVHLRFRLIPSEYFLRFCMDSIDMQTESSVDYVLDYDPDAEVVSVTFDILFNTCSDNLLASFDKFGGRKVFLEFAEYYTELAEDMKDLCVCMYCLDYDTCTQPKKNLHKRCCKNFRRNRLSA